jgi:hypothetical protein
MIKILANFFLLWLAITLAIISFRAMPSKEQWTLIKTATYGLFTATITFAILATIVILF